MLKFLMVKYPTKNVLFNNFILSGTKIRMVSSAPEFSMTSALSGFFLIEFEFFYKFNL